MAMGHAKAMAMAMAMAMTTAMAKAMAKAMAIAMALAMAVGHAKAIAMTMAKAMTKAMAMATGLGKHLTIVAGSLDTETRQLRYVVGAQQPQPILISGGKAKFLPGKGKPAGIFEDASWVIEQIHLPERFALVLLSDGVYDLLPNKEIENKERTLLRYLSTSSDNIDQLKEALSIDYIEDPQDDISVLLLTGGM